MQLTFWNCVRQDTLKHCSFWIFFLTPRQHLDTQMQAANCTQWLGFFQQDCCSLNSTEKVFLEWNSISEGDGMTLLCTDNPDKGKEIIDWIFLVYNWSCCRTDKERWYLLACYSSLSFSVSLSLYLSTLSLSACDQLRWEENTKQSQTSAPWSLDLLEVFSKQGSFSWLLLPPCLLQGSLGFM